jgi:FlaA1/EpsC-like NDP-sugar epimerase
MWRRHRRVLLVLADALAIVVSLLLANLLRFDQLFPTGRGFPHFHRWIQIDLFVTPVVFFLLGMYRSSWRYASVRDLVRIIQAVILRTGAVIIVYVGLGFHGIPRSVVIMDSILLLLTAGGMRLATRVQAELRKIPISGRRVLIVGAGESGEMIVREMRRRTDLDYLPVGFVDDDEEKHGVLIHGVPVLGGREDISDIVRSRGVVELIVAVPSASAQDLRHIRSLIGDPSIRLKAVPAMAEMLGEPLGLRQVRDVRVEDLLGREPVVLDVEAIRRDVHGHDVLVTGGGGSIGRELARQLVALKPSRLILLDRSENNLFQIQMELGTLAPDLDLECCIADIQDELRMREVLAEFHPRVIYHAAAYKHVPMMEFNPLEAVSNNILGTRLVARLAREFGVARFVLISTDKAVHPRSVMGKTKRVAELIIQAMNGGAGCFMAVRFGNVLGSDGSVVPIFRRQIASGGPVTVTHAEATRYFMTIPEAVQLVMQSGTMGKGGEIFMLDMGEPVRIVDLARNLIELSGLRPNVDIDITFTGLRPGEKLHEELSLEGEQTVPTSHEKIVVLTGDPVEPSALAVRVEELEEAWRRRDSRSATRLLSAIVEAFEPSRGRDGGNVADFQAGRLRRAVT